MSSNRDPPSPPEDGATEQEVEAGNKTGKKGWLERLRGVGKKIYNVLSSHVGLLCILVAYTFIGAAIFQAIEQPAEKLQKSDPSVQDERQAFLDYIQQLVKDGSSSLDLVAVKDRLRRYEDKLNSAVQNGTSLIGAGSVWDFWGSVLFCCTVYTTIGYGHIAPQTVGGRVAAMIYAILGVPLCLVVMASFGRLFTRGLKWIWARIWGRTKRLRRAKKSIEGKVLRQKSSKEGDETTDDEAIETAVYVVDENFNLPPLVAIVIVFLYTLIGAGLYPLWETEWDYFQAFYFIFISISTIGFGDVLPDHPRYFLLSSLYVLFGLSLVAMVINVIMEAVSTTIRVAKTKIERQVSKVEKQVAKVEKQLSRAISSDDKHHKGGSKSGSKVGSKEDLV